MSDLQVATEFATDPVYGGNKRIKEKFINNCLGEFGTKGPLELLKVFKASNSPIINYIHVQKERLHVHFIVSENQSDDGRQLQAHLEK